MYYRLVSSTTDTPRHVHLGTNSLIEAKRMMDEHLADYAANGCEIVYCPTTNGVLRDKQHVISYSIERVDFVLLDGVPA